MSIDLFIPIFITRSFLKNLTRKFFIGGLIFVTSGTNRMQILILPDEQLMFNWGTALVNTYVNEKVFILNKTILNILSSFIRSKTLPVDDKNPLWFQSKLETMFIKAIKIVKTTSNTILEKNEISRRRPILQN